MRPVPGFADVVASPPETAPVLANPDPRGPCGARVPNPPAFDSAVGVTLRGAAFQIIEIVSSPPNGEAGRYLDALGGDLRTGCPAFESTSDQGVTQRVGNVVAVDVGGVPARTVAWTTVVETGGQRVNAALVSLQAGPHFALLQVYAKELLSASTVRTLAEAAARRLAG